MSVNLTYRAEGEYLIPDLKLEETAGAIGKYGMMHRTYLMRHRSGTYQSLILSGKLTAHLLEIDRAARAQVKSIADGMLKTCPPPGKETDQMGWVRHMNGIKAAAEEIVTRELIYS